MSEAESTALHLQTRSLLQELHHRHLHFNSRMPQDGSTTLHLHKGFQYHSPALIHMFLTFGSKIRLWITAMLNMFILAVLEDILALMSSLSLTLSTRYHFLNQARPSSSYQASYHLYHLGRKLC